MYQNSGIGRYLRRAPVTAVLAAANILMFLWVETHGSSNNIDAMIRWGAAYGPMILWEGQYWRLLTAAFLHFGIEHIANNMLLLFLMGDQLEQALGHVKFLLHYLLCAIGSNAVSLYLEARELGVSMQGFLSVQRNAASSGLRLSAAAPEFSVGAGASGAVFGVIGGLLWAVIRNGGRLGELSTRQLLIFAGLSVYYGFTATNVDNVAHIAGFVIGFLLSAVLYRKKPRRSAWRADDGYSAG